MPARSARPLLSASRRPLVGHDSFSRCRPSLSPERHQETRHAATKRSARSPARVLHPAALEFPPKPASFFVAEHGVVNRQGRTSDITARTSPSNPPRTTPDLAHERRTPRRSHRNPLSENPDARGDSRPPRANTRLDPCRSHATATSLHRPRVTPRKQRLQRPRLPAHPIPRPTLDPILPANTPPPLRGKRSVRSHSRRFAQPEPLLHEAPGPPAPPCDPLAVSATVCAPVPAAVSKPHPSSSSSGFRSSGSSFPRPPLPPFAFPSQPPPLVGVVLSRPQHLLASRHRLPPVPVMPLVLPARRLLSSGCLPLPATPTASARLFLRAILYVLRPCRTDRSLGKGVPTTNK